MILIKLDCCMHSVNVWTFGEKLAYKGLLLSTKFDILPRKSALQYRWYCA